MTGSGWGRVWSVTSVLGGLALSASAVGEVDPLLGLPVAEAAQEPASSAAVSRLGARLFFDQRLSADGTVSCASCHVPERAFADGLALARGVGGRIGVRNTPSLVNVSVAHTSFFWDGRRPSLPAQAADPFVNPFEHGIASHAQLVRLLMESPQYRLEFASAFGARGRIEPAQVFEALAVFQRGLVAGASAFDRFAYGSEREAMTPAARRGHALFVGRARCVACHMIGARSASFTDNGFHAIGVGLAGLADRLPALVRRVAADTGSVDQLLVSEPDAAALGRFLITRDARDIGAFRTPSLRNVALTPPYMHDGSVPTLAEAVERELYYRGAQDGRPLILTPAERGELAAFLQALTSGGLERLASEARSRGR